MSLYILKVIICPQKSLLSSKSITVEPLESTKLECAAVETEACIAIPVTECSLVDNEVCLPVSKTTCETSSVEECTSFDIELCKNVPQEVCEQKEVEVCNEPVQTLYGAPSFI